MTKGRIKQLIKGAAREERRESRFTGRIGKKDTATGDWVTRVPGRSINWIWVRPDFGGTAVACYNDGAPLKVDAPVTVEYDVSNGLPVIKEIDHARADAYNTDPNVYFTSVPPSPTGAGSGREEFMSTTMLLDGLVTPGSGLIVNINKFTIVYNGVPVFYGGGTQDLTSYVPSGAWGYAVLSYDLTTNLISVTASATVDASWELTDSLIAATSFTNKVPLFGVALQHGQTGPSSFPDQFRDCRPWLTGNWLKLPVDIRYGGTGSDLSSAGPGYLYQPSTGAPVSFIKSNLDAVVDPTVTDDAASGYARGSEWINRLLHKAFICVDPSIGSARWRETTASAGTNIRSVNDVLRSDVAMPSADTYYDGIAVGLDIGAWFITATITVSNASASVFSTRLWDGTTILASGKTGSSVVTLTLVGVVNIYTPTIYKISASADNTNSTIESADECTKITALKIADLTVSRGGTPTGWLLLWTRT